MADVQNQLGVVEMPKATPTQEAAKETSGLSSAKPTQGRKDYEMWTRSVRAYERRGRLCWISPRGPGRQEWTGGDESGWGGGSIL